MYSGNVKKQQKTYNQVSIEQLLKCRQCGGVLFTFIMKECRSHVQSRKKTRKFWFMMLQQSVCQLTIPRFYSLFCHCLSVLKSQNFSPTESEFCWAIYTTQSEQLMMSPQQTHKPIASALCTYCIISRMPYLEGIGIGCTDRTVDLLDSIQ